MYLKACWLVGCCVMLAAGCAGTRDGEAGGGDGQVTGDPARPAESPATEADGGTSSAGPPGESPVTDGGTRASPDQATPAQNPPPQNPPPQNPPAQDSVFCSGAGDCGADEICLKLASDAYAESGPPAQGICSKRCTDTTAACSSGADHYHPCIGAATYDLGPVTACAIACWTQFPWEGGATKQYACPEGAYCSRTIAGMMKICNPYP